MSDDATERRVEFLTAILAEMARTGGITDAMMERVALRFDGQAHTYAGSDREERYTDLANAARLFVLEATGPTASDARAEFKRRQIRERTERLAGKEARRGNWTPDGGNGQA